MSRILVVDDDAVIRTYLIEVLRQQGYEVIGAGEGVEGLERLDQSLFHLVLCDYRLPDMEADTFLRQARQKYPLVPVIVVTGYSSLETAINVMKLGAFNYLVKPVVADHLLSEVANALEWHFNQGRKRKKDSHALEGPRENRNKPTYVPGVSEASEKIQKQIRKVAGTNYSVLIYGESGTGKEVAAWTLHRLSRRKEKPFVAVDCGVLTPELARSELFGHVKGAFTGAESTKKGKFQIADGGTLFLDEIGNLSYEVQGYLLRVIQERRVSPVGSETLQPVDVRIVAASNIPLREAVERGKFREDLYHRLHEYSLELPPLRERPEEIMHYAYHYLHEISTELNSDIRGFSPDVIGILESYSWPGNLRELKNVIRRACLFAEDKMLREDALHPELMRQVQSVRKVSPDVKGTRSSEKNGRVDDQETLRSVSDRAEREKIVRVLKRVNYNKSAAARTLNIDRKTLYNKLKKYDISQ